MPAQQVRGDDQSRDMNYAANDRNDESTEEAGISYKYSVIHQSRRNT